MHIHQKQADKHRDIADGVHSKAPALADPRHQNSSHRRPDDARAGAPREAGGGYGVARGGALLRVERTRGPGGGTEEAVRVGRGQRGGDNKAVTRPNALGPGTLFMSDSSWVVERPSQFICYARRRALYGPRSEEHTSELQSLRHL